VDQQGWRLLLRLRKTIFLVIFVYKKSIMKQVTLHIPDNKYSLFMELAQSLKFVKKIEVEEEPSKEKVLKSVKQSVKEINMVKSGKLKARDARALINEL
jgi:hypothetical protein